MVTIFSTYDPNKDVVGFYGGVYAMLMESVGGYVLNDDEIWDMHKGGGMMKNLADTFFFHSPMDFQRQVFLKEERDVPYPDKEDFGFDKFSFLMDGTSMLEKGVNRFLFENYAERTVECIPNNQNKRVDIADKVNAHLILEKLGIPTPRRIHKWWDFPEGKKVYAKARRSSLSKGITILESKAQLEQFWKNNNHVDFLFQEGIEIPTDFPSYIRVNVDFSQINGAAIMYDPLSKSLNKIPQLQRVVLNVKDYKEDYPLPRTEKEILKAYDINLSQKTLPAELQFYSKMIASFCRRIGLHSMGIDYLRDKNSGKYFCTCDVNRSPGRRLFYEMEQHRGDPEFQDRFPSGNQMIKLLTQIATVRHMAGPFIDYLSILNKDDDLQSSKDYTEKKTPYDNP